MVATPSSLSRSVTSRISQTVTPRKTRLFVFTNILIFLLISVALVTNKHAELGAGLYVAALFFVCSAPALFVTTYRGKASLLLIFLAFYFATFGLKDVADLLSGHPLPQRITSALFTGGEVAVIIGALCFMIGYALTAGAIPRTNKGILTRDWAPGAIIVIGVASWFIGSFSNTLIQFTMADRHAGGGPPLGIFGIFGGFVALFRVLGPLGILMLVYSALTNRSKVAMLLLVATIIIDFGAGFLGDSKETALRGPLLVLFSIVVIKERIPVVATAVFVLVFALAFNFFASYREYLGTRHISRAEAAEDIGSNADRILGADQTLPERFSEGLDYFTSRITLKQNVELILRKTGSDVAYQDGYTIKPLLYAFIPRFIKPDKQDATQTGKIFNREFFRTGSPDTYISVSQLGDLYWNFGWPGLTLGMALIGLVMAAVASLARVDTLLTLPRFLLLLLTVYLLVLRFESGLAMVYTYWARAVVLLLLIHWIVPKARVSRVTPHPDALDSGKESKPTPSLPTNGILRPASTVPSTGPTRILRRARKT